MFAPSARRPLCSNSSVSQTLVPRIAAAVCESLERGGTLVTFGNGGSAADAQHFAGELYKEAYLDATRALRPLRVLMRDHGFGEAEAHAAEDKKFRELVETRNRADALLHATEKSLKDLGDKVDPADRAKVESAATALPSAGMSMVARPIALPSLSSWKYQPPSPVSPYRQAPISLSSLSTSFL